MTPTHILTLPEGYGETYCELIDTAVGIATVRVAVGTYWEGTRYEVRTVQLAALRPVLPPH